MTCNPEKMATSSPEPLRGRCVLGPDPWWIIVVILVNIHHCHYLSDLAFRSSLAYVGDTAKAIRRLTSTFFHLSFLVLPLLSDGGSLLCARAMVLLMLLVEFSGRFFLAFSNFRVFSVKRFDVRFCLAVCGIRPLQWFRKVSDRNHHQQLKYPEFLPRAIHIHFSTTRIHR
jgi:hypothetical protein